ncbi:cell division protein SepF [Candidatus Woesearchaeota archaeon]|nr:cell division protein SepF [Candidatus Woesearchaeota archaeon]
MGFFSSKKKQSFDEDDGMQTEEYVELNTNSSRHEPDQKVIVRPFVITDFADVKPILDSLRESYTIALVNIKPLKEKDLLELKRSINKLKKTCEAVDGDIAGFGDDYIVVTPSFAEIYRGGGSNSSISSPDDFE